MWYHEFCAAVRVTEYDVVGKQCSAVEKVSAPPLKKNRRGGLPTLTIDFSVDHRHVLLALPFSRIIVPFSCRNWFLQYTSADQSKYSLVCLCPPLRDQSGALWSRLPLLKRWKNSNARSEPVIFSNYRIDATSELINLLTVALWFVKLCNNMMSMSDADLLLAKVATWNWVSLGPRPGVREYGPAHVLAE